MLSVLCLVNGSITTVSGSGIRSMSDSWISWKPRIDEPSKPSPSSKTSAVSSCAGIEKCCMRPGRSQKRTSMTSMPASLTSLRTSPALRCSMANLPQAHHEIRSEVDLRVEGAAHRVGDEARHDVRVHVRVGTTVLEVALRGDLDM